MLTCLTRPVGCVCVSVCGVCSTDEWGSSGLHWPTVNTSHQMNVACTCFCASGRIISQI